MTAPTRDNVGERWVCLDYDLDDCGPIATAGTVVDLGDEVGWLADHHADEWDATFGAADIEVHQWCREGI